MSIRGKCRGCGRERQVTVGGTIRRHNNGTKMCSGAGQPPKGPAVTVSATARPATPSVPAPPDEPTCGRSCDGGGCDAPSVGWRLYRGQQDWLPVCGLHMDGSAGRTRIYDGAAS